MIRENIFECKFEEYKLRENFIPLTFSNPNQETTYNEMATVLTSRLIYEPQNTEITL